MRNFHHLILLFTSLLFNLPFCAASNVDSLFQVVEKTTSPEEKIEEYILLLKELDKTVDGRIPKVAEELIAFSASNNNDRGQGEALLQKSLYFLKTGDFDNAIELAKKAKVHFNNIGDKDKMISALSLIVFGYNALGQQDLKLEVLSQAEEIAKDGASPSSLGKIYREKGKHYMNIGQNEEAADFFDKAIVQYEKDEDEDGIAVTYLDKGNLVNASNPKEAMLLYEKAIEKGEKNLGESFTNLVRGQLIQLYQKEGKMADAIEINADVIRVAEKMNNIQSLVMGYVKQGDLFRQMLDTESALENYQKALSLSKEKNYKYGEMTSAGSFGILYMQDSLFEKAIEYIEPAIALADSIQATDVKMELLEQIGRCYLNTNQAERGKSSMEKALLLNGGFRKDIEIKALSGLAEYYQQKGKYRIAITKAKEALKIAESHSFSNNTVFSLTTLYKAHKAIGDYPNALKYQEKKEAIQLQIYNERNLQKITTHKLNADFEKEKEILAIQKQKDEEILNAKNRVTQAVAVGIGAFALLALGFFWNARRKNQLISAQKEQLESLNHTKDRIFAIIGHDLRKPAASFRGISKKVKYLIKNKDFETLDKYGQQIEQNALSLNKLTDNLLNWALTQRDVMPYNPATINLNDIALDIQTIFSTPASEKNIEIINNVPQGIRVYADPNALTTIMTNLVDNAIKYTPEGGQVRIEALEEANNQLKIRVSDTGIGMHQDKINDLFLLQKDKSEKGTSGEKGTGLGLHLVKELVELNKGIISAASEIGKGTSFEVLLPRVQAA